MVLKIAAACIGPCSDCQPKSNFWIIQIGSSLKSQTKKNNQKKKQLYFLRIRFEAHPNPIPKDVLGFQIVRYITRNLTQKFKTTQSHCIGMDPRFKETSRDTMKEMEMATEVFSTPTGQLNDLKVVM